MNGANAARPPAVVCEMATLERYLERPRCESCGIGLVRPVDVFGGKRVVFRCSNARCYFNVHAELPEIDKKVIYLDTSTVSHMARAKARDDVESQYFKLYEALRRATARNLIACPGSTIVETEAEFSSLSDTIVEMSRHLSDPGLHHELHVKEAQLFRALERFLVGTPPQLELAPPWRDAFEGDVDVWHSTFHVIVNMRTPEEFVDSARAAKDATLPQVEEAYRAYDRDGFTFEQMVNVEVRGFAEAVRITGRAMIAARIAYTQGRITDANVWWPSTFDKIAMAIQHHLQCEQDDSYRKAIDFLLGPHASLIPIANISGRLHAALAMLCRGPAPRRPKPGDQYDIEHMATFLPYVDVFIADTAMAALANQNHLLIGEPFQTKIQSLGENDIPAFIDWLEGLANGNEIAALSERIHASIWQGGFQQDFAASMAAELRAAGENVPD
jgi:hypothetical protein